MENQLGKSKFLQFLYSLSFKMKGCYKEGKGFRVIWAIKMFSTLAFLVYFFVCPEFTFKVVPEAQGSLPGIVSKAALFPVWVFHLACPRHV